MKVAIIMGSDSDYKVVQKAENILKDFDVEVQIRVISAHRTPHRAMAFAEHAQENGIDVIIGAAGKAAHLPGVLAAFTTLPIIGLPIQSSTMDGLDSLLSIVQMPKGIPVATVAINGAENAALLAIQMMAMKYPILKEKLEAFRKAQTEAVIKKDEEFVNRSI